MYAMFFGAYLVAVTIVTLAIVTIIRQRRVIARERKQRHAMAAAHHAANVFAIKRGR